MGYGRGGCVIFNKSYVAEIPAGERKAGDFPRILRLSKF